MHPDSNEKINVSITNIKMDIYSISEYCRCTPQILSKCRFLILTKATSDLPSTRNAPVTPRNPTILPTAKLLLT